VDIQGVCKSTVVRGEDDFPSGSLRVTDCHDTIIYALAHLQYPPPPFPSFPISSHQTRP